MISCSLVCESCIFVSSFVGGCGGVAVCWCVGWGIARWVVMFGGCRKWGGLGICVGRGGWLYVRNGVLVLVGVLMGGGS